MESLENLFVNNREWARSCSAEDPDFFSKLSGQQTPEYLWIGCSDSRVPANQIVGLAPGEVFVHRNVANLVVHSDLNCLAVLQYAVDILRVKHILVVGHYGCGGIQAAHDSGDNGLIDNWLRNVKDVESRHAALLNSLDTEEERVQLLTELNVVQQVAHVAQTTILQNAWSADQPVGVHGWVYSLKDGLLRDLDCTVDSPLGVESAYRINC